MNLEQLTSIAAIRQFLDCCL